MITDKKALSEYKRKHDLHVLLFMERHKVTKAVAMVQVYASGIEGLPALMGQSMLPDCAPPEKSAK